VRAVDDHATIAVWDVLPGLGFQPDDAVFSDVRPGLSFDFGNFKLSASCATNLRAEQIILFSGLLSTRRTLAEVIFEMPRQVRSCRQCIAWIVWSLDRYSPGRRFEPPRPIDWIEVGRQCETLLPWVREMGAYNSRPQCVVRRDWMRLALKTLHEHLSYLPDSAPVVFYFDGSVLSIHLEGQVVALAGQGLAWAVRFRIRAGELRRLPKRFMHECIGISIWESQLTIDGWRYDGTIDACASSGTAEIQ
jgi:hypothetical protein